MDPNGDGVISAEELEKLLCGEEGCEVREGWRWAGPGAAGSGVGPFCRACAARAPFLLLTPPLC